MVNRIPHTLSQSETAPPIRLPFIRPPLLILALRFFAVK